jgi:hypothetical protein
MQMNRIFMDPLHPADTGHGEEHPLARRDLLREAGHPAWATWLRGVVYAASEHERSFDNEPTRCAG